MAHELHMVAFNVPWPADYGGVIDMYYRLKALHESGVGVHLHCFTYGRAAAPQLEALCQSVSYYQRDMSPLLHLSRRPFIVASRNNTHLRQRLMADRLPLLLEGVHCCAMLEDRELCSGRKVIVRAHNVESDYYSMLAAAEKKLFRKAYLALDAAKLRRYEGILRDADAVMAVSEADRDSLIIGGCRNVHVVPCGHPYHEIVSLLGRGDYALFHGNLSVPENEAGAIDLIDNVFKGFRHRLVIAGHAPTKRLRAAAARCPNVTLVDSPDDATMARLIAEAQVNVLVTGQPTGLKLKLLYSLFAGRHCVVNSNMLSGTSLGQLCTIADGAEAMREAIDNRMEADFGPEHLERRTKELQPYITSNAIRPLLDFLG
jgi:hypothetical protein